MAKHKPPLPSVAPWSRHDLILRGIKLVDIGYVSVLYFVMGYACAVAFDRALGKFDAQRAARKHVLTLAAELALHVYCIGILTYLVRNVVELVPFPLDGVQGFVHVRLKELTSAPVFGLILVIFQDHLKEKLAYFHKRMFPPGR